MSRQDYQGVTDLTLAAIRRKSDARALYDKGEDHHRGAMYLAGYAIECKIKAIAMEIYGALTLEELIEKTKIDKDIAYSHGLEALINQLPFKERFHRSEEWKDFASHVNTWKTSWRYDPKRPREGKAKAFLDAVDRVYGWLEANR